MLGRMRAGSSLDCLERPPSKLIKDDTLSIYEATLIKLTEGSRNDQNSYPEVAMQIETDCTYMSSLPNEHSMTTDTDCFSPNSIDCQSMCSSKQQQSRTVSVLYLFSKYKSPRKAMATEDYGSAGASLSQTPKPPSNLNTLAPTHLDSPQ
ncbi:uncharacterized protein LOC131159497 [Malania oleifera]|uniref:uncharacterized protein LOC131159497 n=1 Tax=Malania oleifera TaxID=397392 RepID=UPI0025ADA20D|nr:uncharacterized protein LOC131159497 [Malania oleifera]